MERMAGNYFSSKTWQYKKHNKKSPYIPIISFCLENETNGSMQSFLLTQHTLSKRRWGYTWEQWQSSESHWVLPGHCPQHLPQQLGKLGRWSTASPPSHSYPNLHMSPPLDLLRLWSGPAKITTLCEKQQRATRLETDPFLFEYKVYEHIAKNGRRSKWNINLKTWVSQQALPPACII